MNVGRPCPHALHQGGENRRLVRPSQVSYNSRAIALHMHL